MSRKLLLCLTYAGGTRSFFGDIRADLTPEMEVVRYDYPGHGSRVKEPLPDTISAAAEDIYEKFLAEYGDAINTGQAEYGIIGYSMGSIVAYELIRQIGTKGELKMPIHAFLAAHEPETRSVYGDIPEDIQDVDEYIKMRTIEFGGVPESLVDNATYWRIYMPLYKADYKMIGDYDFEAANWSCQVPATVFYSEEDKGREAMLPWRKYFTDKCNLVEYTGKHFFINEYHQDMAQVIKREMGCR